MQTQPLPRLMVMKAAMRPLTAVLDDHLRRGSDGWAHEQRAAVAEGEASGADPGAARLSPLLEYLHLTSEKRFMADLQALRQEDPWLHIPEEQHTRAFQTVVFRLLSRMGCLVHELLITPTTKFPLELFKIIEGGKPQADRCAGVLEDCSCILDDFSHTMLETYPDGQLAEGDGLALLQALALLSPVDTASLERSHGRVSRLLRSQSVQTRPPTFSFLNAQHWCLKYKERASGTPGAKAQPAPARAAGLARAPTSMDAGSKPGKRGGGGPWRAFLSEARRGVSARADFAKLKEDYAIIKAEQGETWQRLQQLGSAGTQLHKETGTSLLRTAYQADSKESCHPERHRSCRGRRTGAKT